ncbi:hypothetical protein IAT40_004600 [Kwoniella sp. CBS 6097]
MQAPQWTSTQKSRDTPLTCEGFNESCLAQPRRRRVRDGRTACHCHSFIQCPPRKWEAIHLANLKHIFWILDPTPLSSSPQNRSSATHQIDFDNETGSLCSGFDSLALSSFQTPITVVNIGTVCRYVSGTSTKTSARTGYSEERKEYTSKNAEARIRLDVGSELGFGTQDARDRLKTISFISLKEVLDNQDWWYILEPEEVERWIEHSK